MITRQCAQGDVLFFRVGAVPTTASAEPQSDRYVVAHSETGHHHVVESPCAEYFRDPGDAATCYLRLAEPAEVVHLRPYDTHATVVLAPGNWIVRRQREYTPQGYRLVVD